MQAQDWLSDTSTEQNDDPFDLDIRVYERVPAAEDTRQVDPFFTMPDFPTFGTICTSEQLPFSLVC